uniref:Putative ribonuclease H-like domain-containing protein n=1 Tax=Tanacetum cinerariifolium TaxID=118510 RepID=A0A6L2K9F2_TANCI|nr:putative ribonuclease H-like domain-containing protein [Tanacetum cinerariifolium]
MDLKWQMEMLTMRARRFLQKTGRNLGVKGLETISFDKNKVECYNFHRIGHFDRECRASKHQDNRNRETKTRTMPVHETTLNTLVSQCDGLSYDWSDQAEDGPTNFTLMVYTYSSSSSSDSEEKGVIDSGCSRHMTRNMSYLSEYEEIDGGYVTFGGDPKAEKSLAKAEAVNTACYVQNRVLVIKPHNKTPYELSLGKFNEKADEGFFIGYSTHNKAFRVFNTRTKIVEENLHITFLENKLNVIGIRPNWMFDIDSLTMSMNYQLVFTGNQANGNAGPMSSDDKDADEIPGKGDEGVKTGIFDDVYDDREVGAEADTNNLELSTVVSLILTTRVHKDHPKEQIIGDLNLATQTRRMINFSKENDMMDVQSTFLYGTIKKEVYVSQPLGFEDPHCPDKVYKVEKALCGLHQAPKSWYETLSTYLLENGFRRGTIDKTLFIKKDKGDILLVQVYVDDIIFRFTKKLLCDEFEQMMHKRFQMSSMGELTFFLVLQVKQKDDGIFISQDKYVADILKKFDFTTMKTASTPMEPNKALIKDIEAEDVPSYTKDFTSSCCEENLQILKRKSTTGGCQFLGKRLISWQCKRQTIVANFTTEAEDSYEKRLIQVIKIHTDHNVADFSQRLLITMASAIICLAKNQKINFSKYIFDNMVLDLEKAKTAQAKEIANLKKRDKKLEKKKNSKTSGLKRLWKIGSTARVESSEDKESLGDQEDASKQRRMSDNIDQDEEITLVDET